MYLRKMVYSRIPRSLRPWLPRTLRNSIGATEFSLDKVASYLQNIVGGRQELETFLRNIEISARAWEMLTAIAMLDQGPHYRRVALQMWAMMKEWEQELRRIKATMPALTLEAVELFRAQRASKGSSIGATRHTEVWH